MILGDPNFHASASRATLDDLFRRAGVRHADALALIDPPNRSSLTDGGPRRLTYAQADHAISAFAARLRALGLQTDSIVALQFGNTVESVIALLGTLRAGMIAALLPQLWRRRDIVAALAPIGAKAIVTAAQLGGTSHADIAMQAAAELFPVRHVCGFGRDLPDGVTPLDDVFTSRNSGFVPPARPGNPAAHVALVTFDVGANGLNAVQRNHLDLVAGGLTAFRDGEAPHDANILSAIMPGSFAGVALGIMPWLSGGGRLELHHAFDPEVFAQQCRLPDPRDDQGSIVVLPGPVLGALADADRLAGPITSIVALWRSPERLAASAPWHGAAPLIDVAAFGEADLIATARGPDGLPAPLPDGAARTTPGGITVIGGYRFRQGEIDKHVAEADADAVIVPLPDAFLTQRLAGSAPDRAMTAAKLQAAGCNALAVGAFRPRNAPEAA